MSETEHAFTGTQPSLAVVPATKPKCCWSLCRMVRRAFFAIGLALTLGGVGQAIYHQPNADPAGMMLIGGLLLGLTIPFPSSRS